MMRSKSRMTVPCLVAALGLLAPAASWAAPSGPVPPAPTVIALTAPADGSAVPVDSRPTFAFDATPGGRFRVQFSSSAAPFIPVIDSGRRTTPGDQYKPNTPDWRAIVSLGAGTNTVYWRVIALHMTQAEIDAAPIASFTLQH